MADPGHYPYSDKKHASDEELLREMDSAFQQYLQRYFTHRDLEGTLDLLGPEMTGFGTALDERGDGIEQSRALYARDVQQAPNPIDYQIEFLDHRILAPGTGLVRAVFHLKTTILDQEVKLLNARLSAVMVKHENRWLLAHKHLSLPTAAHGETESYPIKELEERMSVLERLVQERTRELQDARDRLQELSETDPLTGIFNRLKADQILDQELARFHRYGEDLSVILLDVDFFKDINDTLGHQVGDSVLCSVATLLSDSIRDTDRVARWGGEEFLVMCPATREDAAAEVAERLRSAIASYDFGIEQSIHASFGVAQATRNDTREVLVERADMAMYRAKNAGRNRVEVG